MIIPILQMGKERHGEVVQLVTQPWAAELDLHQADSGFGAGFIFLWDWCLDPHFSEQEAKVQVGVSIQF
jgi:hypothetical protein